MRNIFLICFLTTAMFSCEDKKAAMSSINPVDWDKRTITSTLHDSLQNGTSYLSVYSQIFSQTEYRTHGLTATVSMRNTNRTDTIYINKAVYYDSKGNPIRTYFEQPIFIAPLETVEIVIDEKDREGGTGANFLFDWSLPKDANEPLFEGIMISTSGQQGLSFTTQGQKLKK